MGATAPAPVWALEPDEDPAVKEAPVPAGIDRLRESVLNAVADAGQPMLVSMLAGGQWDVEGNELVIKVAASSTVIEMSLGNEARRLITATASGALGRAVKLKVISGGSAQKPTEAPRPNGSGRSRAEQDPIVRRMQEKFGAEIRTIIDYREKR